MFDEKTIQKLKFYVYLLVDPRDALPFYVGKGTGNRVFAHLEGALKEDDKESLKYDVIRDLHADNLQPLHLIVRHGLTSDEAFEIEAGLIDTLQYMKYKKTNIMGGHHSEARGLMTSDEIMRLYNAEEVEDLPIDVVSININKKYKRGFMRDDIAEAIKEAWVIAKWRRDELHYVLAEYRGLIVEVFEIEDWYEVDGKHGFIFKPDAPAIASQFMNKSVVKLKNRRQWSLLYSKELKYPGKKLQ